MTQLVLPYHLARLHVQNGDIIFICNKGTRLHRLITYFTKSHHIHVGIAFWINVAGTDHLMISEANGGAQRRIVNLSHYKDHDMEILTSQHEWDDISKHVLGYLGQVQYNWIEAAYIGINELFEHLFSTSLPKIEFPGEICSEFVANCLGLKRNYLSPAKLYEYMVKDLHYHTRVFIRSEK